MVIKGNNVSITSLIMSILMIVLSLRPPGVRKRKNTKPAVTKIKRTYKMYVQNINVPR